MNKSVRCADFAIICRICLIEGENMMSVNSSEIIHMLEECTSVQESVYQNMPQQICNHCFCQLKNAYKFKQQCILSLEILCTVVKDEKVEIPEETEVNISNSICQSNTDLNEETGEDNFSLSEQICSYSDNISEIINNEDIEEDEDKCKSILSSSRQKSLADLLRRKYNIYDLKCNICSKELSTRATLLRHMKIHDKNRSLNHRCSICNKGFYAIENLKTHENRHLGKTKFQCDICPKRFYVLSALGSHYRLTHKAEIISCDKCDGKFYHKLQLEKHMNIFHEKRKYVCHVCGKEFSLNYYLREHQITHSEERSFICSHCNKGFKHKATLKSHLKLQHVEPNRREVCNICGKLVLPSTLRSHLESHNKGTIYTCTQCGKVYNSKYVLRGHIKEKHAVEVPENKIVCHICNKSLISKRTLQTHLKLMHSEAEKRECHICGKTYKLQCNVNAHILSAHMDVRPHTCSICSKSFHTKTLLRYHSRTHTGERPFSCTVCNKSFSFKSVLKTHMNTHNR